MRYEDFAHLFVHMFTVAAQPVDDDRRQWLFTIDPVEAERRVICREIAEDMARAGLGWHEDAIERLTRPPVKGIAASAKVYARLITEGRPRFLHRRYGIRSRYKGKVRDDATA